MLLTAAILFLLFVLMTISLFLTVERGIEVDLQVRRLIWANRLVGVMTALLGYILLV